MLTLDECRKVLGAGCKLSDTELAAVRDQLYGLADIAVEVLIEERDRNRMHRRQDTHPSRAEGVKQITP